MNLESAIEAIRQKLSRGTSAVSAGIADLRDRIREKREDLRHAERAPLPLEDLRKRIVARVEADGEERLRRYGGQLVAGERSLGAWVPKNRLINLPEIGTWGSICAADPEAAAAHLEALVARALDRHSPGAPLSERQAKASRDPRATAAEPAAARGKACDDRRSSRERGAEPGPATVAWG